MNSLSKQYKDVFGKELLPFGFRLYKKTFYRVINDVVQTIMLRKTDTNFTLDFSILPLSLPVNDLYCEGYDIAIIGKRRWWWDCWGEIGEDTFAEILTRFRQHVIPLFERGINSATAYDVIVNIEKMIYNGLPNEVYLASYPLFLMSVKVNDYEKALRHLSAIMRKREEAYQHFLAERKKEITPVMNLAFERFMVEYRQLQEMMEMVSTKNVMYFQQLIATNESISLEYLKDPRKRSKSFY